MSPHVNQTRNQCIQISADKNKRTISENIYRKWPSLGCLGRTRRILCLLESSRRVKEKRVGMEAMIDNSGLLFQGLLCWSQGRVEMPQLFIQGLTFIIARMIMSNNLTLHSIDTANLPYLLPGGPPGAVGLQEGHGAGGGGGAGSKMMRQQSHKHPLDGVNFSLSSR